MYSQVCGYSHHAHVHILIWLVTVVVCYTFSYEIQTLRIDDSVFMHCRRCYLLLFLLISMLIVLLVEAVFVFRVALLAGGICV